MLRGHESLLPRMKLWLSAAGDHGDLARLWTIIELIDQAEELGRFMERPAHACSIRLFIRRLRKCPVPALLLQTLQSGANALREAGGNLEIADATSAS